MWGMILGFLSGSSQKYGVYIAAAMLALLVTASSLLSVYFYGKRGEQLKAAEKERDYYRFQLNEAIASHNDYVAQLGEIQWRKDKVQVIYRDRMRRINDEAVGTISGPLVIFSMREFDAYTSATAR